MRIGLIDIDYNGSFPNIPLMKISAWHKSQGNDVEFYLPFSDRYDTVYMSKIFSWSEDYKDAINADSVVCGGTGYQIGNFDGSEFFNMNPSFANRIFMNKLPESIEHIYPDYSIYPTLTKDTAFGFLTRGCPRGCSFCHVAAKEGRCSVKVAGHTLFEFNKKTKEIKPADIKRECIFDVKTGKPLYKTKTDIHEDCFYLQALNVKNAEKKLRKLGML